MSNLPVSRLCTYQIWVNQTWATVTPDIFRSWSGQRQITDRHGNVRPYAGPVYLWLSSVRVK